MKEHSPEQLQKALVSYLESGEPSGRAERLSYLIETLDEIGADRVDVDSLRSVTETAIKSRDPVERSYAIDLLNWVRPQPTDLALVRSALSDPHPMVRVSAVDYIGSSPADVFPNLRKLLEDSIGTETDPVVYGALYGHLLVRCARKDPIGDLLEYGTEAVSTLLRVLWDCWPLENDEENVAEIVALLASLRDVVNEQKVLADIDLLLEADTPSAD
jgi:hypothetical protein